jgi:hypothetical protein
MRSICRLALAGALALTIGVGSASAQTTTSYSLNSPNSQLSGFTGPYGSVEVDLNAAGNDATIIFTSNTTSNPLYLFGGSSAVGVNVNDSGFTHSATPTESNNQTGFTPTFGAWDTSGGNVDSQGSFNLVVNNMDGYGDSASSITFHVFKSSGTWSSAANVLTANASGKFAEAHVYPASNPANANNDVYTGQTGFTGTAVPEPGPLLGAGVITLIGLGYTWRRRRRAAA